MWAGFFRTSRLSGEIQGGKRKISGANLKGLGKSELKRLSFEKDREAKIQPIKGDFTGDV